MMKKKIFAAVLIIEELLICKCFFTRKGKSLGANSRTPDYLPGDIVTWDLGGGIAHIGIVVDLKTKSGIPVVVHNYGGGQVKEDILFG